MKNKEKYAKEIIELACDGYSIAIDKKSGRIAPCGASCCADCLFCEFDCHEKNKRMGRIRVHRKASDKQEG